MVLAFTITVFNVFQDTTTQDMNVFHVRSEVVEYVKKSRILLILILDGLTAYHVLKIGSYL